MVEAGNGSVTGAGSTTLTSGTITGSQFVQFLNDASVVSVSSSVGDVFASGDLTTTGDITAGDEIGVSGVLTAGNNVSAGSFVSLFGGGTIAGGTFRYSLGTRSTWAKIRAMALS